MQPPDWAALPLAQQVRKIFMKVSGSGDRRWERRLGRRIRDARVARKGCLCRHWLITFLQGGK